MPRGRPRIEPNRWKAVVAMRIAGLSFIEIERLIGEERRNVSRNYKRDLIKFLPGILKNAILLYWTLKEKNPNLKL